MVRHEGVNGPMVKYELEETRKDDYKTLRLRRREHRDQKGIAYLRIGLEDESSSGETRYKPRILSTCQEGKNRNERETHGAE